MADHAKMTKALELMKKKDLDGLIVYSDGTMSILRPSYLHYFSGFHAAGRRNAAVLNRAGTAVLLIEPDWDTPRAKRKSWIGDVRGTSDFLSDIGGVMDQLGIKGRVGVAGTRIMTKPVYDAVSNKARIEPADAIVEEMQLTKAPEEIELGREAARVADIGFEAFLKYSRPGMREYEVSAEMDYAMRMAGADDMFILLSSGPHNYEMHSPTDRRLSKGDIVIGEITPVLDGQFFQLCRTVVIGEPSPVLVEKYTMLMHAFEESIKELVPGRASGMLSRTMNRIISDAGYGQYCYPPYMRARGHGFGVGSLAPGGAIDNDTRTPCCAGQLIVVHPNQYIPETGYLACGETLLVTEAGPERLARTDTRLYVNEV